MLNYGNLNDVEFEYLCQDVMSKKLNLTLRRFAPGQDGGIDLKGNSYKSDIIVQVKHYMNSSVSQLMTSLKKEVPKVKSNHPSQYYVCCSKQLSPQKVKEIYLLFSDYMTSEDNVTTLSEIEDFLVNPANIDILKKHYKLWLSSTSVLEDIFTKDICIDCEALLSNIEEEERLFVQTSAYNHALECLSKNRCLLITGNPGVGKTVTSKMLILYFAAQGYKVRYTTDGNDLASLKRAISQSPETKEIILLDDCLGQAYFNMKETQGNELLAIIRHVKIYKNKILILNSRVTIYQEAQERTPLLVKSFETKEYKVFLINMDAVSDLEKARILYNHLYFNDIERLYFDEIKKDKRYLQIIKHKNYNPRIIEFVTNPNHMAEIAPEKYYAFVLQNLDNPSKAWEDEYIRRLSPVDRILLTTLYSITNTTAPYDFVKECFEHRIASTPMIDYSINNFLQSIHHLQRSFITIVDVNGIKMLSMVNPSVNDFISSYLEDNPLEKEAIISMCCSVKQYKRMANISLLTQKIAKAFDDQTILNFAFENSKQKTGFVSYYVATYQILDKAYMPFVQQYLSDLNDVDIYEQKRINAIEIIENLVEKSLFQFYNLGDFFYDPQKIEAMFELFELEDLISLISCIAPIYSGELQNLYIWFWKNALEAAIETYCCDVDVDEFDLDIGSIISCCSGYYEDYGPEVDTEKASDMAYEQVSDMVLDKVKGYLSQLPIDIQPSKEFFDSLSITVSGCDDLIDSYIKSDYDDDDRYHENHNYDTSEIDLIFDR